MCDYVWFHWLANCLLWKESGNRRSATSYSKVTCSSYILSFVSFLLLVPRYSGVPVQFSCLVVSDSLWPYGLQHTRLPCPSPTPGAYSNSCPLSRWCHSTISSSVVPFFSCLQSFPASESFPVSRFFASGGQSIGASALAPVLPMSFQDWSPLGWTGLISVHSKGLSRVFSNTTVQKRRFFIAKLSLWSIHDLLTSILTYLLTSIHDY